MIKVVILGSGNVAIHLTKAFLKSKKIKVIQVYSRKNNPIFFIKKNIEITNQLNKLKDATLYIIAISDDSISRFSKQLNLNNKLVVHTSGSMALQDLQCNARKGVFYPLQTLSKNAKVSFKKIPICLESENEKDYKLLEKIANSISTKVYKVNSEQRKYLHLAAVFVNNFTNHLYKIGHDICTEKEVSFAILKPLIQETAKKIKHLSPSKAQTGPAKRKDIKTIKNHLNLLNKKQQEIYKLLTKSISHLPIL
ncbi:MAG: DUF2520 domain-containing protein [Flavobacteriaceae bacterium]|nr:DUF2520 domain-containing protein [Flavobacteriaceae bacterium]